MCFEFVHESHNSVDDFRDFAFHFCTFEIWRENSAIAFPKLISLWAAKRYFTNSQSILIHYRLRTHETDVLLLVSNIQPLKKSESKSKSSNAFVMSFDVLTPFRNLSSKQSFIHVSRITAHWVRHQIHYTRNDEFKRILLLPTKRVFLSISTERKC